MTERTLRGCTILVVEDEYLLAEDLCVALVEQDVQVIGPAATLSQALHLLRTTERLDGAVLDVNLRGEPVFALADALVDRAIPFMFTTGYDVSIIPARFSAMARYEKPIRVSQLVETIGRIAQNQKV